MVSEQSVSLQVFRGIQYPQVIKVFDPNHWGRVCASGRGKSTLRGWIVCNIRLVDLPAGLPAPNHRSRWWSGLFPMSRINV